MKHPKKNKKKNLKSYGPIKSIILIKDIKTE